MTRCPLCCPAAGNTVSICCCLLSRIQRLVILRPKRCLYLRRIYLPGSLRFWWHRGEMSLFLILVAVTANPYPQDCFGLGNRASIAWARFSGLGTRSSCCVPFRRITSAAWGTRRTVWWLARTHRACGCLFPVLGQTDILIASLWLWQTIQQKRFTVAHSSKVQSIMAEKAQ